MTRTINSGNDDALNVTIQEVDRYWLIQCYKQSITTQNITEDCGSKRFLLPIEAKFNIGGREYGPEYGEVYFSKDGTTSFKFNPITLDDPFRKNIERASKNLKMMQEAQERMQILNKEALELMIRENPLVVGVSGSAIILIPIISIILCCLLKDKITKLMELQMMSNMNNGLSRSATNLNHPGISINFGMSHQNTSQNGSVIYPVLEDRSSMFRDRCTTPYRPTAPVPEKSHRSRQDQEEAASLAPSIRSIGESICESVRSDRSMATSLASSIRSSKSIAKSIRTAKIAATKAKSYASKQYNKAKINYSTALKGFKDRPNKFETLKKTLSSLSLNAASRISIPDHSKQPRRTDTVGYHGLNNSETIR